MAIGSGQIGAGSDGELVHTKGYVVIVEDDPQIRLLLVRWLADAGYDAAPPADAKAPALVVVDVPDPHSAEPLIAPLRAYAVPILVLSARFRRGLAGSAEAARRLGVTKVLPKPFNRRELLSAVRESTRGAA